MTTNISSDRAGHEREFVLGPELRARLLTLGEETEGRFDLTDSLLPANATEPLHLHTRYAEHFYVVSGTLTVLAGADQSTLGPGSYYVIPRNVPHVATAGPEGVHALLINGKLMSSPVSNQRAVTPTTSRARWRDMHCGSEPLLGPIF